MPRHPAPRLPAALVAAIARTTRRGHAARAVTIATVALPGWALAHDGHGLTGSHWHAGDTAGVLLLGVAVAAGVWWSRRK